MMLPLLMLLAATQATAPAAAQTPAALPAPSATTATRKDSLPKVVILHAEES